jgi:hypothetical protein
MTHPLDRQPRPAVDSTVWERRTAMIRDWVQIIAVIGAGAWAFFHFRITEAPAGAKNFAMSQQLDWERIDSTSCYAVVKGGVENLSSSGVRITKVGWKVWLVERTPFSGAIAYQDPDAWASTPPTDSLTYTDGPFVGEYAPRGKSEYALTWRVRERPGLALFKVELFPTGSSVPTDWFYAWDEICNGV